MTRGTDTEVAGLRRRGRVAHLGGLLRRRHPGRRRRTPTAPAARSASPGPGRSTRTSSPPRWPTPATTPASPRPTPTSSWPNPTASPPWSSTCGTTASRRRPWRRRSRWRIELERATRCRRPPGPAGLVGRLLGQPGGGGTGLDHRHLVVRGGARTPSCRSTPSPGRAPRHRPAPGSASAGGPATWCPTRRWTTPSLRATRMLGAQKARSAHCTVVFDPRVVSTLLAVMASRPVGRGRRQGALLLRRPHRRDGRHRRGHAGRRPDRCPGLRCRRRTTARGWPAGATCSSPRACCACSCTTRCRPAGPGRSRPGRRCGADSPGRRRAGCRALVLSPGTKGHDEILAAVGEGLYVQSISGIHSGVNTVSGDFSVGAEGLMIEGGRVGRSRCGRSRSPRRCSGCCSRWSRSAATCAGSRAWPRARPWPSPTWRSSGD